MQDGRCKMQAVEEEKFGSWRDDDDTTADDGDTTAFLSP